MQTKDAVEKIITRTAESLAYPQTKHLCTTCARYIRSFCPVGMDITHGDFYHEILSDYIAPRWKYDDQIPGISISITSCTKYKKERR